MVLMVLMDFTRAEHVQGRWWTQGLCVLACARGLFQRARSARSALRIIIVLYSSVFQLLVIDYRASSILFGCLAPASQFFLFVLCVCFCPESI